MGDPLNIREIGLEDLAAVAALEAASFPDPWSRSDFAELLAAPLVQGWSIWERTSLVGYIVIRTVEDEAEVLNLAVAPDARRRGMAGRLLGQAIEALRLDGVHSVYLEVRRSNSAAQALYRGRGFSLVGVRQGYYRKPEEDALVLRRQLGPRQENGPLEGRTG